MTAALPRAPSEAPSSSDVVHQSGVLSQSAVRDRSGIVAVREDAGPGVLGRLHADRSLEIDLGGLDRLRTLVSHTMTPQPWTVDGDLFVSFRGGMRPLLHHGDLRVRGSLLIDDGAWLICTGSLVVDEILSDHRRSTVAVGGDLFAPRVVTRGALAVLGSAKISDVAFVRDFASPVLVGGAFEAPSLLHYGPCVHAASLLVDRAIDLADAQQVGLALPSLNEALTVAGAFDPDRCDRHLRCGLSLTR